MKVLLRFQKRDNIYEFKNSGYWSGRRYSRSHGQSFNPVTTRKGRLGSGLRGNNDSDFKSRFKRR